VVSSVCNILDTAIRKVDRVRASDGTVGIRGLSGIEVGLGVVISNTILVRIGLRGLLVDRGRGMVGRCSNLHHRSMVSRGSNLDHRGVVSRGSNNRSMVGRGSNLDNRGMVNWSLHHRSMVGWGSNHMGFVGRGMIGRGMVGRSSNNRSMVSRGSMVNRGRAVNRGRGISGLNREGSRGMDSSGGFLKGAIAMYRLWASMGLADHRGMYSAMGLVDRVAD